MSDRTKISRTTRMGGVLGLAVFAAVIAAPAMAQNPPQPSSGATPVPKILVIDRNQILRASKVGQDIVRQVGGFSQSAEKEFKGQADGLRREYQDMQRQLAILSPDVKNRKQREFEARQAGLQKKVEARQQQIQYGVMVARAKVEQALGPILQGIMNERGANLLLDRQAIVLGTIDVDVTRAAVERLDRKMPKVQVTLQNPPAQQQQQQQPGR